MNPILRKLVSTALIASAGLAIMSCNSGGSKKKDPDAGVWGGPIEDFAVATKYDSCPNKVSGMGTALFKGQAATTCCIQLNEYSVNRDNPQYISTTEDLVTIKPVACEIAVIRGSYIDIRPIYLDLSAIKAARIEMQGYQLTSKIEIQGRPSDNPEERTFLYSKIRTQGEVKISDIKLVKADVEYGWQGSMNSLSMNRVEILGGTLRLFGNPRLVSDSADNKKLVTEISLNHHLEFNEVKISSSDSPIELYGYPMDVSSIQIEKGQSRFAPHIKLKSSLLAKKAELSETRFPIIADYTITEGSELVVNPGVLIKTPDVVTEWSPLSSFDPTEGLKGGFYLGGDGARLTINGSPERPVRITSFGDDTNGGTTEDPSIGDTNGDSGNTQGTTNAAFAVISKRGSRLEVNHAQISHSALYFDGYVDPIFNNTLSNVTFDKLNRPYILGNLSVGIDLKGSVKMYGKKIDDGSDTSYQPILSDDNKIYIKNLGNLSTFHKNDWSGTVEPWPFHIVLGERFPDYYCFEIKKVVPESVQYYGFLKDRQYTPCSSLWQPSL